MTSKRRANHRRASNGANRTSMLERVAGFYHLTLAEGGEGMEQLKRLGLHDAGMVERFEIGYASGGLLDALPRRGDTRDRLTHLGLLEPDGTERMLGCLTFPLMDADGGPANLCGLNARTGATVHLPGSQPGLWNLPAALHYPELHLATSIVAGLALVAAELPNVIATAGNALSESDIETLSELGVTKLIVIGQKTSLDRLAARIAPFAVTRIELRQCLTKILKKGGPDAVREAVENAHGGANNVSPPTTSNGIARRFSNGFEAKFGKGRQYQIRGLQKGPRSLQVTIRAEQSGRLHVDTLDLYSARARRQLAQDLCRLHGHLPEAVEADIMRLVRLCENYEPADQPMSDSEESAATLTEAEREEGWAFGRSPDLIERLLADYEACGLIGEKANKLLCYLAAVSRKMTNPISVLILSSSGAGKSALQDATLAFCPPEDVVRLTSLTGKALFYKARDSLRNKILALEEHTGAQEAAYAIRSLISAGELIIETTVKDLSSGRLTTMENRVEGPTAVFFTTTDPDTDPETRSRFFVTSVDESREQTQAILEYQRKRQTLDGLSSSSTAEQAIRRHRSFQRLIRPLAVVNPYADQLTYRPDSLRSRRDQPKYLNLIRAVAFLRQMAKPVKDRAGGTAYIEADLDDMRIANDLAARILGQSLDDLNAVSRELLMQAEAMVRARIAGLEESGQEDLPRIADVNFTRRDLREFTGWSHSRVVRYLKQLVELECVDREPGGIRRRCVYRLLYAGEGKDGSSFLLGLRPVDELRPSEGRHGK